MNNDPTVMQDLRTRALKGDANAIRALRSMNALSGSTSRSFVTSVSQRRIWLQQQMNPASAIFVMSGAIRLKGTVDAGLLGKAFSDIRDAHSILRSVYFETDGKLLQREISGEQPDPLSLPFDLSAHPDPLRSAITMIAEADTRTLDLENGPVFTAALYHIGTDDHVLHVRLHHIAGDGWSVRLLMEACAAAYARRVSGGEATPPPARQYRDFAAWQAKQLGSESGASSREYWREKLADAPEALDLPLDRPRSRQFNPSGGEVRFALDDALSTRVSQQAAALRTTPFVVLTAGLSAFIHRYAGIEDVVVGTVTAGRDRPEVQNMIGCFVNTVPLRVTVKADRRFSELVRSVATTVSQALAHQDFPYEQMVEEFIPRHDRARQPLMDVVAIWEDDEPDSFAILPGVTGRWLVTGDTQAKFDLTFLFRRLPTGNIETRVLYSKALWNASTIQNIIDRWIMLQGAALGDNAVFVGQLPLFLPGEESALANGWHTHLAPIRPDEQRNGLYLFEQQATKTPSATALVCGSSRLTYGELNQCANRLARRLTSASGVGPGDRVAVLLPRSAENVGAILAILKTGGVYVPLDQDNPPERLAELAAIHRFRCLITRKDVFAAKDWAGIGDPGLREAMRPYEKALLSAGNGQVDCVDIDQLAQAAVNESPENTGLKIQPRQWMYIIHTSGSTGKPEPVAVSHSAVANLIDWVGRELYSHFDSPMREAVNAPLFFDVSIQQIFGSLSHGHTCHLIDDATRQDLVAYDRYLHDQDIDFVNFTPSLLEALLSVRQKAWPVRVALIGAEVFPQRLLEKFWSLPEQRRTVVYNMYGPTECCVDTTYALLKWPEAASRAPSLGKPVDNLRVYVLDEKLTLVPPGVPGELCVSGPGLAEEYVGNREKTITRFVPHPFRKDERLYRTGDKVRWRLDGTLEFLGRLDAQLKIRGYRVEPGEIEARLAAFGGVSATAVVVAKSPAGTEELVAFVVAPENYDCHSALRRLASQLPEYMTPKAVIRLDRLPTTPSGKVDRRALAMLGAHHTEQEFVPPSSGLEEDLAVLWGEILGVDRISRTDSFLALGGNSLQAMRLSALVGRRLGYRLTLGEIFSSPVLAGMAERLAKSGIQPAAQAPAAEVLSLANGLYPLSAPQKRLWIMNRMNPGSTAYSMPEALFISGPLDDAAFISAARQTVAVHSSLRTVYPEVDGEGCQRIRSAEEWSASFHDVSGDVDPEATALDLAQADRATGFDLENGFPFRLTLVQLAGNQRLLILNAHHIAFDGGSLRPFIRTLEKAYSEAVAGRAPALDNPPQYSAYATWQNMNLESGAWETHRQYWLNRMTSLPEQLAFPADSPRPPVRRFRGARTGVNINAGIWNQVEDAAAKTGANRFMACVALARLLLWRHSGQKDILLGVPVSQRSRPEWENLVGYCVNNLALRIPLGEDSCFTSLLEATRRETVVALENADYPFDRLVEELPLRRDAGHSPLLDAMVVFEDVPDPVALGFAGLKTETLAFASSGSRFDLTFIFRPLSDGGMSVKIEYDSDLFSPDRIARVASHLTHLAEAASTEPEKKLSALDMLPSGEFRAVAAQFAFGPVRPLPREGIFRAVARTAETYPEAVALYRPESVRTYTHIIEDAGRVARVLREAGATKGCRVGVSLPRGPEVAVAILGVLAAGCVHVPFDPRTPNERRAALLRDAECRVVLTSVARQESEVPVIRLRDAVESSLPPLFDPSKADEDAYIIYTSGSTGVPKGVELANAGFLGMIRDRVDAFGLCPSDRVLQFASLAFDASLWETFLAWCSGASLAPVTHEEVEDIETFTRFVNTGRITFATLPPTYLRELAGREWPSLRLLVTAGEAARPEDAVAWGRVLAARGGRYINAYGPTETSVCASTYWLPVDAKQVKALPIGRPVANTALWVVNAAGQPQPMGVPGELLIAGQTLAKGYCGRAELTRQSFIPAPEMLAREAETAGIAADRVYRTGDLACWSPEGNLEFVGRADWQVKIRGHRVELGEIENSLLAMPGIDEACAVVKRDTEGGQLLLAYVSGTDVFEESACLAELSRRLPSYMIPSRIIRLATLPLTVSGKIDRQALPEPSAEPPADGVQPPTGEREEAVAVVWSGVLRQQSLDKYADFFRLGGDSIRAIQCVSRLKADGWLSSVAEIFSHPVLADFAATLQRETVQSSPGVDTTGAGPTHLSPMQAWYFRTRAASDPGMAQEVWLACPHTLAAETLQQAWETVWRRHPALRTRFTPANGLPLAEVCAAAVASRIEMVEAATDAEITRAAIAARESLIPWSYPLVRVLRFPGASEDRLYLVAHHLIIDGVSWRILIEEFDTFIRDIAENKEPTRYASSALPSEYAQVVSEWLTSPDAALEAEIWRARDAATNPVSKSSDATWLRKQLQLSPQETAELISGPFRVFGANPGEALLAAATRAWRRISGGSVLKVMVEGHGREGSPLSLERTVGWFTAMFPIILDGGCPGGETQLATLRRVKDEWRLSPRFGTGYAALRWLSGGLDWPDTRPDMRFNYLGHIDADGTETVLSLGEAPAGFISAGVGDEQDAPDRPGLDVTASVIGGKLRLALSADSGLWDESKFLAWLEAFREELVVQAAALRSASADSATLSVHPWKGVVAADWTRLLAETGCSDSDIEAVHPLSPMQEGMLFHAQYEKNTSAYHEQFAYAIRGHFDPDRFRQAWDAFANRHGVLRSRFAWKGLSRPLAVVMRNSQLEWRQEDWREGDARSRDNRFAAWLADERGREFSLSQGPLTRLALFRFGHDEWRFVWSHHHILMDGWCLGVARAETLALYRANSDPVRADLPPAPLYRDFIAWIEKLDNDRLLADWAGYLEGYSALASPPGKRRKPLPGGPAPENIVLSLTREATQDLRRRASAWGVSLNHCVEAAWALILARANRADDVVFARVSSGRPASLPGADSTIGLFINATPVRVRLDPDRPFSVLAATLRRDWGWAETRQYCSLGAIQAQSPLGRGLLDSAIVFEQFPETGDKGEDDAFTMEPVEAFEQAGYPCWLAASPGDCLDLRLHYDAALFTPDAMLRLVERLAALLAEIASPAGMALPISKLLAMPDSEWRCLSHEFNATETAYPRNETITRLVAARAKAQPNKAACECRGRVLTYSETAALAGKTASALREAGVGEGAWVGVGLERSERLPAVLLGIMSVGAAYVPLDPEFPEARRQYMVADAELAAAFVESSGGEYLPPSTLRLTDADINRQPLSDWHPGPDLAAGDRLAYVLYTSGSTGLPKGVKLGHRGLTNFLFSMANEPGMDGDDVCLAVSSLAFDISGLELLLPLMVGGKTVVAARNEALDGLKLADRLSRGDITVMQATPATWQMLFEAGWTGTPGLKALCGGEGLPRELADKLLGATAELWNLYGPTETTIWSTVARVTPGDEPIHLGRPIANTIVYILNSGGMPCPIDVAGELCIGGDGLAVGYHHRDDLTAERFFQWTPPGETHPIRLYRTGDLAFSRSDGNLGFLGREDFQVKIRGHRIELGEIEQALLELTGVRRAVVVAFGETTSRSLAAYVVMEPGHTAPNWREALARRLPAYMIPSRIVLLAALPLTPNGKVDRKALPAPDAVSRDEKDGAPPRAGMEAELAELWREALTLRDIRREDDFFLLGGHSLKMVRLAAAMRRKWGAAPELSDLFAASTLAEMAVLTAAFTQDGYATGEAEMTDEERSLLEGLR
jgi:amino acid adenylation domain-containing protein/non-ribosomal peptide synthase protein (TIGR01720 family)